VEWDIEAMLDRGEDTEPSPAVRRVD